MDNRSGDKQKSVRLSDSMIEEIESWCREDVRTFSDQMRYLIQLGLRERRRIEQFAKREIDPAQFSEYEKRERDKRAT